LSAACAQLAPPAETIAVVNSDERSGGNTDEHIALGGQ
jgi:hypothetical protein